MPTKTASSRTTRTTAKKTAAKKVAAKKVTAKKVTAKKATTKKVAGTRSRPDAIAVLKQDHREVKDLFSRFERAGDGAGKQKRKLVDLMIADLSRHASIEEQILYPWARENIDGADDEVLEALEEHHVVKWLLWELEDLDPGDERFDAKVTVMMENVRHHVEEEENELFSDIRDVATRAELLELGEALRAAKKRAPTRPHPRGGDTPPANIITAPIASVLDHARDVGKDVVGRFAAAGNGS
jgi:hemerythrin-like domain-containing protein